MSAGLISARAETSPCAADLSPEPILRAVDAYRGKIIDLDTALVVDQQALARSRKDLESQLLAGGLLAGNRVVLAVANGAPFVAAFSALLSCGAAPLLVHFQTPPAEMKRFALRFRAKFVLCDSWEQSALQAATLCTRTLACQGWAPFVWGEFAEIPETGGDRRSFPGIPLHPTSGSTGLPKLALRPGPCAIAEARHYMETIGVDERDVILALPPMSHAYGYGACMMVPLLSGASIVTLPRLTEKRVRRALDEQRISILPTVPAALHIIAKAAQGGAHPSLRHVFTAGSLLTERTAQEFKQRTGMRPCPLYGTTETGGISVVASAGEADVAGRVGRPMNGVSVEVRRTESSSDWGPAVGRLYVRSASMMAGYLDQDDRLVSPLEDGWFETGDLAQIDSDGAIRLKGRETEVINVSGMKVIPCEVEEVLSSLSEVVEAKVYPGPHRSGSQIVKAAVVTTNGLDTARIRSFCEQNLAPYKRPHVITLLEALPRSATGKILRDRLP